MHTARSAFSLVELSIVLVILGLLTGGILAGQSLIHAAELRAITTEYSRFATAAQSFRDKYFALPGDMANATRFWGFSSACPGTAGSGTQTCDGNGDGFISAAGSASQYGEMYTFWQHLANAGLIEGTYTGMSGSGGGFDTRPGINEPKSKFSASTGWSVLNEGTVVSGSWGRFGGDYTNALGFGGAFGALQVPSRAISAPDAWNIDTKLDDGKPASGKMWAGVYGPDCTVATTPTFDNSSAAYFLTGGSNASNACTLFFKNFM